MRPQSLYDLTDNHPRMVAGNYNLYDNPHASVSNRIQYLEETALAAQYQCDMHNDGYELSRTINFQKTHWQSVIRKGYKLVSEKIVQ